MPHLLKDDGFNLQRALTPKEKERREAFRNVKKEKE